LGLRPINSPSMFQTTRRRLALWYTTVTAILLLVFASGFYGYVRLTLIDRIDDTIDHVVEVLERSLVKNNLEANFSNAAELEADHIDIEWFNSVGDLIWTTLPQVERLPLALQDLPFAQPIYRTIYLNPSEPLRQLTKAIALDGQLMGYLRVSHPWFEFTKPIQQLFLDLTVGTTLMIVVVALCGWWLSGLAMQPVRDSYQRLKQFTADASHELRNPIAVIQTNVQVALADPAPNLQTQQLQLEVIERLTRRLTRLLDDLLFLARQDGKLVPLVRVPCHFDRILHEVVEEQQIIAQAKQIDVELSDLDLPVQVLGDRDQLVRLFTNLIGNSIAHTPDGGKIKLTQELLPSQNQIQIRLQDNGVGMPEAVIPHIFERFYRYQPQSTSGSGLGLSIVKAIVENHQGQIRVESSPNLGTTFTITLPITKWEVKAISAVLTP